MGDKVITTESTYPVLLTVTKEINEPRLPSLMQILGSANKPIHEYNSADLLQIDVKPVVTQLELKGVSMQRKNIIFKDDDIDTSIKTLVDNLVKEGMLR